MIVRAATRGSALALWQTEHVAHLLSGSAADATIETVIVSTAGDRDTTSPIHAIGGKGVFVKEVQAAVLDGRADVAVHSAKDLPAETPDGLVLASIPVRADPRDALVGARLADLAPGATVGTGSIRRRVQLQALRPDLQFEEIRGNIDTRLARVGELDLVIMAAAALDRLGRSPDTVDRLDVEVMIPQVGQGALAIECRADDAETLAALRVIEDPDSRRAVGAERGFLRELGGDCDLPAGAYATVVGPDVEIVAVLSGGAGSALVRAAGRGTDGERLGRDLAVTLRQRLGS